MQTEAIANALGGLGMLGRRVRSAADLAQVVREGLPADAVKFLANRLDLTSSAASTVFGIPLRSFRRRLYQHGRLTPAESDRAARVARVYATAVEMIGNESKAVEWLRTPNRALGGEIPLDTLDTDPGAREVEDILGRIAYGVYS